MISRDLAAFAFEQPYEHCGSFSRLVTSQPAYLPPDVLKEVDSITMRDLQRFTQKLWNRGFGQALVQGNLKQEQARPLVFVLTLFLLLTASLHQLSRMSLNRH